MKKICFNTNWYFKFGENVGDEFQQILQNYNLIGLPHSFGIPYYGGNDFYVGYGTYYKTLECDFDLKQQKILLEFGAVFQTCEVFVNQISVGGHKGGYTAFVLDITKFLKQGNNTLFVRVDNNWCATLAPRAGEHLFNGGIYRDVNLLVYPNSHIDWCGIQTSTKKISETEYELSIAIRCVNCEGQALVSKVADKDNRVIYLQESIVTDGAARQTIVMQKPVLWDTENPYLYTLSCNIGDDNCLVEFGVRTIEWNKQKGFFLNGKRLLLEGANVHQDHGGWGDAVTHSGIQRDINIMKGCGFNFIRGSHYPHHTEFAKECDRQGLLFWSENVFWGIGGFGADGYWNCSAMPVAEKEVSEFEQSLKQQLAEMIKTNYNSPSIICWSMGNEIFFSDKSVLREARQLVSRLVEYCHTLDGTRPAAVGGTQRGDFDKLGDVAGYNGDGAVLFKNPPVANMVAEYGSIPAYRPGQIDLYETKGSDQYYDWRAGRCIWCGFHHGSIADIGNLGICDLYRLPLNAYYAYRKKNLGISIPSQSVKGAPTELRLSADRNNIRCDGTDDTMLVCEAVNKHGNRVNSDLEITLVVKSGALLLPTGKTMLFNKQLKNCFDGMCAIEARGYGSGVSIIYATCGDLISNEVKIELSGGKPLNGQEIVFVAAPSTQAMPKNEAVDILKDRPVTVSSENVAGSSICLTTQSGYRFWSPNTTDNQPKILLDMENMYQNCILTIRKTLFSALQCCIYSSKNKEDWTEETEQIAKNKFKINHLSRYIKIVVNKRCKIKQINIVLQK